MEKVTLTSNRAPGVIPIHLFRLDTSGFEMELFTKVGSGRYVALGLSEDSSMGDDLVIMCGSVSGIKLPNS